MTVRGAGASGSAATLAPPGETAAAMRDVPIFCLACRYVLDGIGVTGRCPECGRPFDRDDASTVAYSPVPSTGVRALGRVPAFWLMALAPGAGILDGWFTPVQPNLLLFVLTSSMAVTWVHLDARARGLRLHWIFMATVFFMPVVFVPVHLAITRRVRAAGPILTALGVLMIAWGMAAAARWIVFEFLFG